jgi:hypothetical protein
LGAGRLLERVEKRVWPTEDFKGSDPVFNTLLFRGGGRGKLGDDDPPTGPWVGRTRRTTVPTCGDPFRSPLSGVVVG